METLFWHLEDKIGKKYLMIIMYMRQQAKHGLIMNFKDRYHLSERDVP